MSRFVNAIVEQVTSQLMDDLAMPAREWFNEAGQYTKEIAAKLMDQGIGEDVTLGWVIVEGIACEVTWSPEGRDAGVFKVVTVEDRELEACAEVRRRKPPVVMMGNMSVHWSGTWGLCAPLVGHRVGFVEKSLRAIEKARASS